MTLDEAIELAEKNAHLAAMESSAEYCLGMAKKHRSEGNLALAHEQAVRSLKYSLGILHPLYSKAILQNLEPIKLIPLEDM